MYVVSAPLEVPEAALPPLGLSYGTPIAFGGCAGFFHPAEGDIGVVLCAPWGFEDLTMRKSWRLLAEAIAAAGFPCLRFDYPGTGDSLGGVADIRTFAAWTGAIHEAADELRRVSGVRSLVFLGQSLGAALAMFTAANRCDVIGLQLIAPVINGRAYVRELAATAVLVAQRLGIQQDLLPGEALSVVGFAMSQPLADSLKTLDLLKFEPSPTVDVTIFDQADRKAGAELSEHFRRAGAPASLEHVEPYHLMVSDATVIQPLPVAPERVVEALRRAHTPLPAARPNVSELNAELRGADFNEVPLRFGQEAALFGVLCDPPDAHVNTPVVILLNRGLNSHIGWRRISVEHARALAAAGISSLRIDVAGLGESRDEPGRPVNLIYSDLLLPDIAAAVDMLAARGHERIALTGVCSGAHMAFTAAVADPRVTDVISFNPQRLVWNPAERADEVIRYGLRSMDDYVSDLRKGRTALKKLLRSRERILPAMRFLLKRKVKTTLARVPLKVRSALMPTSMARRVNAAFAGLAARNAMVSLVFTAGDPALEELRNYFGPNGRDLRYANVTVTILPDSDHNLTTNHASNWMLDHIAVCLGVDLSSLEAWTHEEAEFEPEMLRAG